MKALPSVLLVDDDVPILTALNVRLQHAGFEVTTAQDALSAVIAAERCLPDAAVIDVNLPGANGFQLAEALDQQCRRRVPRVFITANKQADIAAHAVTTIADGFLEKPFDTQILIRLLRTAMGLAA